MTQSMNPRYVWFDQPSVPIYLRQFYCSKVLFNEFYHSRRSFDHYQARAAMIWIIGEYSNRIDNADELLENFLDNFHDEPVEVQLQLLTASVRKQN